MNCAESKWGDVKVIYKAFRWKSDLKATVA